MKNHSSPSSMLKGFAFIIALTGLVGCQRYEWVHPTKSLEQFERDKYACEVRASRLYPIMTVIENTGGGYVYGGFSHCHHSFEGYGACYPRGPVYVPPTYSTHDANEMARNQAVETCLFGKGYEFVPAQ